MGLDIYGANYPEQNIYLKNSTTIGVKASVGSGIGANVGLGYNFKIGKNERWEIPVFFSSHFGSIDYGDFTVTDKSSGISVVSTSTPVGFNSFNLGAGITYKF
jgi:outer membrane scaffolding protein for murein synthesis (MipA/OmpV family)